MAAFRRAEARDMDEIMRVVHEAQAFMRTLEIDQWQDGYPEPETLLADIAIGQLYVFAEGESVRTVAALSTRLSTSPTDPLRRSSQKSSAKSPPVERAACNACSATVFGIICLLLFIQFSSRHKNRFCNSSKRSCVISASSFSPFSFTMKVQRP